MAAEVARTAGLALPEGFRARQLRPDVDIVHYDLVCVMDKFTAADVLREVRSGDEQQEPLSTGLNPSSEAVQSPASSQPEECVPQFEAVARQPQKQNNLWK